MYAVRGAKRSYSEVDPSGANIEQSPYSQLGRVTYTAELDTDSVTERVRMGPEGTYYRNTTVEPRVFDVVAPDLLLQRSGQVVEYAQSGTVGHYTKVFASMNSLRDDDVLPKWRMIQKLRFAGVAQGGVEFVDDKPLSQHIAVTTGGSHTIFNNGIEPIMAGDELYWDIPDKDTQGRAVGFRPRRDDARGRIPAVIVRPYHPDIHGGISKSIISDIMNNTNPINTNDGPELLLDSTFNRPEPISVLFDALVRFAAMIQANAAAPSSNVRVVSNTNMITATNALAKSGPSSAAGAVQGRAFRQKIINLFLNPDFYGYSGNTASDYTNIFVEMMNCFAANMSHVSSRKFAKATSNATPGKPVDVVLGTYRTG
jgi:hypothetical protein